MAEELEAIRSIFLDDLQYREEEEGGGGVLDLSVKGHCVLRLKIGGES